MLRLDNIKTRILLFALVAILIPALSTAGLSYRQNRRALNQKLAEELTAAASQTARELDLWLKERLYDVRVFASSYEVSENIDRIPRSGASEARRRLTDYLGSLQERFDDYAGLLVADRSGRVLVRSGTATDSGTLAEEIMQGVRTGEPTLGQPFRADDGEAAIRIGIPVVAGAGRVLGALGATLRFHAVEEILARFAPGTDGELYLVAADGRIIASSRGHAIEPLAGGLDVDNLAALRERTGPTVEYTSHDGRDVVGALATIPRSEWAVVAEIPRGEAFAEIAALRNTTLVTLAVLLAVVGGIGYALGTLIVRPLDRLTGAAREVAGGNYDVDIPVSGGGEVALLTEVFNDMVARIRKGRETLQRLSITDELTGLYNRRHLIDVLEEEVRRSKRTAHPFAVLMVDVDHFKKFNDQHGHLAGDQVLKGVAQVLRRAIREVDRAGRYGGEEFAVVLPETGRDRGADVAKRIQAFLAEEDFGEGTDTWQVTLSIGVAEFPEDGDTPDEVLGAADAALYQAKRKGRDRVVSATRRRSRAAKAEGGDG